MSEIECAFYLIGKFYINTIIRSKEEAVKCSILAVEEILKETENETYWNEVKNILNKL
ncbi:MAG: hypothetical protein RIR01_278 [Bacteroidota bacterium]|jgi:hypothetical protein